jgi:serine/threonine protein kinase
LLGDLNKNWDVMHPPPIPNLRNKHHFRIWTTANGETRLLKRIANRKEFSFQQEAYVASSRYFLEPILVADYTSTTPPIMAASSASHGSGCATEDETSGVLSQLYLENSVSLKTYIEAHDHDAVRGILEQLREGIAALDESHIEHGDLSAEDNILVHDGTVKIIDFDQAIRSDDPQNKVFDYPVGLSEDLRHEFRTILRPISGQREEPPAVPQRKRERHEEQRARKGRSLEF